MRLRILLVLPTSLALAGPPATASTETGALRWTADAAPFRLTFQKGHQPVLEQATGDTAGPGDRMAYQLADGSTHRLTNLVRTEHVRDGLRYEVATDEPGRTAT